MNSSNSGNFTENFTDTSSNLTSDSNVTDSVTLTYNPGRTVLELREIPKEYIKDYSDYRHVLESCNHTLYTETHPQDAMNNMTVSASRGTVSDIDTPVIGNVSNNDSRWVGEIVTLPPFYKESMEIPKQFILDYMEYKYQMAECNKTISESPSEGSLYCNATWDTMQCWGYMKAGTSDFQPCPPYITLSNPMAFSVKTCNPDGTWFRHPDTGRVWTNYSMCYDHTLFEKHKQVMYMYYYGYSISIVLLIISLIIFSMFRQLKCVRVTLHKHLFISYVLNGAMWILYYSLVPMNSAILIQNPAWCQVLHVLTHYFTVCNYAWMFCEGFYIHAIIVITFTKDKKLLKICYLIGWVFPLLPIAIYTCVRALNEADSRWCWTSTSLLNWILAGPINASLLINFVFSINIMRILLSKLRSVHNQETMQTRRAVRATLILIPLLGIQFIAFPFKPPPGSDGEYTYSMIIAAVTSFQGVFVSLVFCFFNGEVMKSFKKCYHHLKLTKSKNFHKSSSRHRQNGESTALRSISHTERLTTTTDIGSRTQTTTETTAFLNT